MEMMQAATRFLSEYSNANSLRCLFLSSHGYHLLLHGPPGTGKTRAVMQMAAEMNKAVVRFTRRRDDVESVIAKASSGSVFLFDEIDRWLFSDGAVNEDYAAMLMSILDGTASPTGAIIVLVTNNLQKIPEAMRRPGRVVTREWGYVTSENAYRLFNFVFPNINEQKLRTTAQEYVRIYNSETASVLTEKLRGQPEFDAFCRVYLH
jgi:Cdc6-like AAA superfamily ATPase